MEYSPFLLGTMSLCFLIVVSAFLYIFSKKYNFPYTSILLITGILFVPLSQIPFLGFISEFKLTPDIVFYVFLPILIFEGSYNINYRILLRNIGPISILSVLGVLISTFVVGYLLYFILLIIGIELNILVCLLFGSLISATDPVAILAIFKKVGVPKRLTVIFEGESLFNDGTSLALFYVLLGIIMSGGNITTLGLISGAFSFLSMIFGAIVFGLITGFLFSYILGKINYNEEAEISLAIISAYITFILAESVNLFLDFNILSSIIATVISSIVIGNYGRYKITPKSEEHMGKFLEFSTFLANSIVFISMGFLISNVDINFIGILDIIIISIIIMVFARYLSVYFSVWISNKFAMGGKIASKWEKLLVIGGLKGVIALIMVLLIPGPQDLGYDKILLFQDNILWPFDFNIKDLLIVMTISSISFTIIFEAGLMPYFINKIGLNELYDYEKIENEEWKTIANLKIIEKLEKFYKNDYMNKKEYKKLKEKYELELKLSLEAIKEVLKGNNKEIELFIKRLIFKYALGIEKQYLKKMFFYKKIDEKNFKYILGDIEIQIERLNMELQYTGVLAGVSDSSCFLNLCDILKRTYTTKDMYIIYRTRHIIFEKVILDLEKIPNKTLGFDKELVEKVIGIYQVQRKLFNDKKEELFKEDKRALIELERNILNKTFLKLEEKLLTDLYNKEIIPSKTYSEFTQKLETKLYKELD